MLIPLPPTEWSIFRSVGTGYPIHVPGPISEGFGSISWEDIGYGAGKHLGQGATLLSYAHTILASRVFDASTFPGDSKLDPLALELPRIRDLDLSLSVMLQENCNWIWNPLGRDPGTISGTGYAAISASRTSAYASVTGSDACYYGFRPTRRAY